MHNSVNEITQINATPLTYDNDGDLTNDGTYTYRYDEEHRLTGVTQIAGPTLFGQYQYDALSRRVQKIANPTGSSPATTLYFYDDVRIVEEENSSFTTQATYVYGAYIDEILTMDRGGQTYYYHQNEIHSVLAITNSSGNPVERYNYCGGNTLQCGDPYGSVTIYDGSFNPIPQNAWGTAHSAIGNPWLFTGRQFEEETGLYYYRARHYDPVKGRFLERDGPESATNLYEYVRSRPTAMTDPMGTEPQWTQQRVRRWNEIRADYIAHQRRTAQLEAEFERDCSCYKRTYGPDFFSSDRAREMLSDLWRRYYPGPPESAFRNPPFRVPRPEEEVGSSLGRGRRIREQNEAYHQWAALERNANTIRS
jgi:RHS repeat-associated protein